MIEIDWAATHSLRETIRKSIVEILILKEKESDPEKIKRFNEMLLKLKDKLDLVVAEDAHN
jgi:hypothetical protein